MWGVPVPNPPVDPTEIPAARSSSNSSSDSAWMRAYFTWVKVFALSFALGRPSPCVGRSCWAH
jgi:hypothetical protein